MVTLEVSRYPPGQKKKANEQSFKGAQQADNDDVVVVDVDVDVDVALNPPGGGVTPQSHL